MSVRVTRSQSNVTSAMMPYWSQNHLDLSKISLQDKQALCVRCNHYGCGMQAVPYPCLRWMSENWEESQLQSQDVTKHTQCPCFNHVKEIDGVFCSL